MGILIVDDDSDLRNMLRLALETEGYQASCAANGREALTLLRGSEGRPCLVLLDIMMPVMNGWDVLEHIVRDRGLRDIPVVVMSGHLRDRRERDRASRSPGMFLQKPISLKKLLSVVGQFCSQAPEME